jgi:gliding motility-associated-like protein
MLNTQKHTTLFSLGLQPGIKPVFFIFLIFFQFSFLKAQENLVPNGSFEEYWECPMSNNLNNGQFEKAKGWWSPTNATPDYFNRCNNGIVGVPNNFWGYQETFHGDGYVGFGPISWTNEGEFVGSEYMRTKLIKTLKPCIEYTVSLYVSLADYSTHGVGKIGIYLSDENELFNTWLSISKSPQIVNDFIIADTSTWIKIEGTLIASGNESFLTIGYFENDVNHDTVRIQSSEFGYTPYFYVDCVEVYQINIWEEKLCEFFNSPFPNVITPNNDGKNDFIDISDYLVYVDKVVILNRWGNVVTSLNNQNVIWDGKDSPDGVYYFYFDYLIGGLTKRKTGFIHLIR